MWGPVYWGHGTGTGGGQRRTPIFLKYGQDNPPVSWYVENAALADSRPFDGVFLNLDVSSHSIFTTAGVLSQATVEAEMEGFHEYSWQRLVNNFPTMRNDSSDSDIPDWWDDEVWEDICQSGANFVAGTAGQYVTGIAIDNEHYLSSGDNIWDWQDGAGIDPTHTLEQSRAKVQQRGQEFMDALLAVQPDLTVFVTHGPYVSDPRTGVDVWTTAPFWNPVADSNDLQAWFFFGMFLATVDTPAALIDGGQVYGVRTQEDIQNVREWREAGMLAAPSIIPAELVEHWPPVLSQAIGDFDEFNDFALQTASAIGNQLDWSFREYPYVLYYTEEHTWWDPLAEEMLDIDAPEQAAYKTAVTEAWSNK